MRLQKEVADVALSSHSRFQSHIPHALQILKD